MASDSFFWVPHPEEVWLPGKHTGGDAYQTGKGEVTCTEAQRGPEISDNSEMEGVDDCCTLVNVSAANILHTTRVRFMRGEIYTSVSNVLIAVNPFKRLQIYGQEQIEIYKNSQDRTAVPPHVFGVCAEAFAGLFDDNKSQQNSQAVLISGESGAGKTETTKLVLLYTSEMLSGQEGGLEDLLMEINPILEAFGNAKTVRNNNSSRFGKWIEVCVDPAGRQLKGVSVVDYLLEVTRVCGQGVGERNYHIFYQLAADAKLCSALKLEDAAKSIYLKTNPMAINGVDDVEEFSALKKALTTLNFNKQEELEMYQTVAAILHIGNFEFSKGDEAQITNKDVLANAAELLQVEAEVLGKCITHTRRIVGKEVMFSPSDPDKAKSAKDSMTKLLYGMLFKWIVVRCNESLGESFGQEDMSEGPFLGVLDIAGFESFEKNLLEQLLINLSNEKLQQFFNNKVFKTELAEYKEENIDVADITFANNDEILNLIEGAGGVLSMLDDATNGVKQTDKMLVEKLIKEKAKHENFLKPKKFDPLAFGIRHYAGDVMYNAEGFLEKNVSAKPPEIIELCKGSKGDLLPTLVGDEGEAAAGGGGKKPGKKATVGAMYKKSLQLLMEKLKTANCHFIRCIKPNAQKVPDTFTSVMVMDQLRLCGVMETVSIRKAGYLIRSPYADFVSRYMICIEDKAERKALKTAGDLQASAKGILKAVSTGEKQSALGKTKVFLKGLAYQTLEATRRNGFEPFALLIQAVWRGHTIREQMKEVKEVNDQLKKCIEEAGHKLRAEAFQPKTIHRPTLAENTLKHFDILLMRAVNLPIKLGYIHEATKVRAHISAEAALARKLENLSLQLNVFEMEEALALARHHKMEGTLVEKVEKRLEAVKIETPLKETLHAAVDLDELEDLQKAVAEATEKGLDNLSQWTMPSGAAIMEKAMVRKEELEEEKRKREAFLAAIRKEVEDHIDSSDLAAVQETLARAAAAEIQNDMVDKLASRCAALEIHLELQNKLQECTTKSSIAEIEAVIKLAEDQGIRDGKWTLPTGAEDLANAEKRISELQAEKEAEERARQAEMDQLLEDIRTAATSTDYDKIQDLVSRGKDRFPAATHPDQAKELEPLEQRLVRMDAENDLMKKMQGLLTSADSREDMEPTRQEARDMGLADNEEAWIMKEGFSAWQALEERLVVLEDKEKIIDELKQAADQMDVPEIEKIIAKAVALGIPEEKYKSYNQLNAKLQNTNHVRDLMIKHKGNETIVSNLKVHLEELQAKEGGASSMLELKLKRLVQSSNTEMMRQALREADRADLKSEVVDQIRALCITLERQQPQLQKLQEVLWNGDMGALQAALTEFREGEGEESMSHGDEWPCEGLKNFYDRVCEKVEQLESEKPPTADIEAKLHVLKASSDVIAIREGLKEAERLKFTGPVLEEVTERFKAIEKQKSYLMQIRHCVLSRDPDIVRGVLEEGMKRSLDNPSNWLLEDGPRSYALLSGYLKELEAKKKGDDTASVEVAQKLREMKKSTDVGEIRAALAKATANKVKSDLTQTLEDRVKRLETQQPLLKSLKGVLRSEDAEAIQKLIVQVRDADLVNPRNWVWPDGPKVFSKAVTRKVWCEKVEDLNSRAKKAMEIYNVKELEECFKASEFMGVSESKLKDAKALYLQLQKSDYVEQLLADLDQKKNSQADGDADSKIDEAVTCLVNHRSNLGLKTDHSKLKDVSERMAHTKSERAAGGKPYYSGGSKMTDTVFHDLANYKNLRDPMTWPTDYPVSPDPDVRTRAMVSFQAEKIVQSLTVLKPYSERIAAQNFLDLLRCMGDKPCAYTGDKQDPILKRLTVSRAVCDEIYCQVMKQLSSNPGVDSISKGWELLQNMVKVALPSAEVYEFLLAFTAREATPPEQEKKASDAGTAEKKGGWKVAFFEVMRKQREEQMDSMNTTSGFGNLNMASVASMALHQEREKLGTVDGKAPRRSMVERQLAREKRKSRVAAAEDREEDITDKRKAFAHKQVDMAAEVLRWLGGTGRSKEK